MPWDPDCYHQFRRERLTPFDDLLSLIRREQDMRVVDLGCGTGELTLRLADALPGSDVVGLDASREMLDCPGPVQPRASTTPPDPSKRLGGAIHATLPPETVSPLSVAPVFFGFRRILLAATM